MYNNSKPKSVVNKILVVDDNVDAAFTLQMLLKLQGFQVEVCYSGPEAIVTAESLQPDVILMDISMPGMNGYEAGRLIREQPQGKEIIIIALTGFGKEEDQRLSFEAGFNAHLTKPVDIHKLLDTIQSLCAA